MASTFRTYELSSTCIPGVLPNYENTGKQVHTRDEEEEARWWRRRRWWWQGAGEGEGGGGEEEDEDGEEVCVQLLRVSYE